MPQTTARENSGIFPKGYCLEIICSAIPRHKRDWDWLLAEGLFDLKLVGEVQACARELDYKVTSLE